MDNKTTKGTYLSKDVIVTVQMKSPINHSNIALMSEIERMFKFHGYDISHVNVQLAVPIGGCGSISTGNL